MRHSQLLSDTRTSTRPTCSLFTGRPTLSLVRKRKTDRLSTLDLAMLELCLPIPSPSKNWTR